jgi:hypothetical protein
MSIVHLINQRRKKMKKQSMVSRMANKAKNLFRRVFFGEKHKEHLNTPTRKEVKRPPEMTEKEFRLYKRRLIDRNDREYVDGQGRIAARYFLKLRAKAMSNGRRDPFHIPKKNTTEWNRRKRRNRKLRKLYA